MSSKVSAGHSSLFPPLPKRYSKAQAQRNHPFDGILSGRCPSRADLSDRSNGPVVDLVENNEFVDIQKIAAILGQSSAKAL
jgi:hypothetical protein